MKTPIPVVAAVIERDGLILVAQRPAHKLLPLKWEFPGGKVEPGEDSHTALVREIREELGCVIEISGELRRFVHHYTTLSVEMIPLRARLAAESAEPIAHEHVALRWVRPEEIPQLDLPEADLPIVRELLGS